jgi:hypothetical protein
MESQKRKASDSTEVEQLRLENAELASKLQSLLPTHTTPTHYMVTGMRSINQVVPLWQIFMVI